MKYPLYLIGASGQEMFFGFYDCPFAAAVVGCARSNTETTIGYYVGKQCLVMI
jgi:hypothetical protein